MKINVASIWNHHHPNLMNNGTAKIGPNGHFVPSKQKLPNVLHTLLMTSRPNHVTLL
jgi:hypothetical protein